MSRIGMMLGPHHTTGGSRAAMPWPQTWKVSGVEIGGMIQTSASVYKDILEGGRRSWQLTWVGISEDNRNTLRTEYERTVALDFTAPDQGSTGWYEVLSVTNSWLEDPVRDRTLAQGYFRYNVNFSLQEN